jgi:DNA primase
VNADREFVDRVRSAADMARTVGEYVSLRKAGRRLTGLCPFHAEKTPSFYVDEQKQLFHCFGCGVGGDVFKFLMLHDKLEFREALESLAERNGIEIPRATARQAGPRGLKERLLEANSAAAAWFRAALADESAGRPGREYLAKRGLRRETVDRLGIGFAPKNWDGLQRHLLSRGFTPEELVGSGLCVPRNDGTGSYDRFRERVMFPIASASGKVVAFGGRTISTSGSPQKPEPKYMNSPETAIYSKSELLYGLYAGREALRKQQFAVLVEGYLDFASLFEAGIENTVASLGTALTEGHAKLLSRHVDCVVVNYDADAAGRSAALRSFAPLVAHGLRVKVLRLPAGEDPDVYVRRIGKDGYLERIDAAPDYMDYAIEEAASGRNIATARDKVLALNAVLPLLAAIESPIERSRYVPVLADRLAVEDELILGEISKAVKGRKTAVAAPPPAHEDDLRVSLAEAGLVRVLVEVPDAASELAPLLRSELLEQLRAGTIVSRICALFDEGVPVTYDELFTRIDEERTERLLRSIAMQSDPLGDIAYGRSCIESLELDHLMAESRRIQRRIDATSDGSQHAVLTARKFELSQRIRELS